MPREQNFSGAIFEALDLCLQKDPGVFLMGLGVPDPKGIFGTTAGLQEKYGAHRVMDMPTSENGMTGVAIGMAAAFALAHLVAGFLFGVTMHDPLVFATVPLILALVALVAAWLPAQLACATSPMVALRAD